MRLSVQVIDFLPALHAEDDSGTICLEEITVEHWPVDNLGGEVIARIQLVPPSINKRVDGNQLQPNLAYIEQAGTHIGRNPLKFDPAAWEANTLYWLGPWA